MGSGTWLSTNHRLTSTTFHTPFGRYRWRRLPFGISSAPEVFQRKMHKLVEGLSGIEVVADDFIVVGCGNTIEEANRDLDKNLVKFLERCKEQDVKLNTDKLALRQNEVPFIGHVATHKGLRIDPAKVRAINEMPSPTDKAGVQRLLGLAQYLGKFLPHLSDITKPLRELTQNDVEWVWGDVEWGVGRRRVGVGRRRVGVGRCRVGVGRRRVGVGRCRVGVGRRRVGVGRALQSCVTTTSKRR